MSNLINYAKEELSRIDHSDEMQDLVDRNILELIEVFSNQNHSGMSGAYVLGIFNRLVNFLPIMPLTGEDDEWNDVSDISERPLFQNKRCGRVFKDENGRTYDINYRYFVDDDGMSYTSKKSSEDITFPYYPEEPIKAERRIENA